MRISPSNSSAPVRLVTFLCLAAWFVGPWAVWAQDDIFEDEETRRHGIFLDSLDVSLINIEVYAEMDGEPVMDLTVEDFEVFDDGEPVEITHFYRVSGGRRIEQLASDDVGDEDGGATMEMPGEREPSTLVILVDHAFLSPGTGKLVYERISERLEDTLALGTRIMVASKDTRVEVVEPLTSDIHAVRETLQSLTEKAGLNRAVEDARAVESILTEPLAGSARVGPGGTGTSNSRTTSRLDARGAMMEARAYSLERQNEMLRSVDLLRNFLGSLAGVPGRKALLYVADRLPTRPGELVWQAWYQKYGFDWGSELGVTTVDSALREFDVSTQVQELIADANSNRIAFYPMGIGADSGLNLVGAESRGLTASGRGFSTIRESNRDLQWLAGRTGGRAAIGRGDVDNFFRGLDTDLTEYYSLAYPSPHRGDGKTHEIEVRVRRPGVKVRYLEEYRDKSGDHQMAELTFSSLMLGIEANPLGARVELGKPKRQKDGFYKLPLEVQVPMANLVLLPGESHHSGKLTLILIVRDTEGGLSDPVRIRLPFEVPHQNLMQAMSQSFEYPTELVLRPGKQVVAVGLRDDLAAIGSTLTVDVEVGP